jgi:hypothetical protein
MKWDSTSWLSGNKTQNGLSFSMKEGGNYAYASQTEAFLAPCFFYFVASRFIRSFSIEHILFSIKKCKLRAPLSLSLSCARTREDFRTKYINFLSLSKHFFPSNFPFHPMEKNVFTIFSREQTFLRIPIVYDRNRTILKEESILYKENFIPFSRTKFIYNIKNTMKQIDNQKGVKNE